MSDPTFVHHFGNAVQADILRQAARDQRRHDARPDERTDGATHHPTIAARLVTALWACLGPVRDRPTTPSRPAPER